MNGAWRKNKITRKSSNSNSSEKKGKFHENVETMLINFC